MLALAYLTTIRAFGVWRGKQYKYSKRCYVRWRKQRNTHTRCDLCHRLFTPEDPLGPLSIDHIIPRSIFMPLNLYALEFHYSNFRLAHQSCNEARGDIQTLDQLPRAQQRKLTTALATGQFRTLEGINKVDMSYGYHDQPSQESIRRRVKITVCQHENAVPTLTDTKVAASASPTSDSAILATA